ncbi:anti-sigma regulatory factor (Ser/Thr protein kinase) [Spinactinospora alkalitolerans]|uniref:Anti-sigma regulatory factor (Ser/Thr protein kinase) n=1 Tax=Spinactinospora alkalitolerans TaxID=687207 RepID=A0A852TV57_9ACTN|nr:ATP-binding protein [Spinactinospora alkalitolerans]NYE47571.1 anti-sigma regulatory factor (Ser/Thr protein kinase) [Spinactinospora alkalitolerans]
MESFSAVFSGTPNSVATARHWLEGLLASGHRGPEIPDDVRATAVLLLSELATNAVRHTRSSNGGVYTVRVHLRPGMVGVEVEDRGPLDGRRLELAETGPDSESGRGLALVEAFADLWGPLTKGCGVFFRLSWTPDEPPPPLPRRSPGRTLAEGGPFVRPHSTGGRAVA